MIGSSIRSQLTLWYAAVLSVTMALLAVGLYLFVRADLLGHVNAQTEQYVTRVDSLLRYDPSDLEELEEYGSVTYYRIADGETDSALHRSAAWTRLRLGRALRAPSRSSTWQWETPEEEHFLLRRAALSVGGRLYRAVVAERVDAIWKTLERLLWLLIVGTPGALLIALAGGYVLAGRALRPVGEMAESAQAITADRLSERLPVERPEDEFGRLATAFNNTLDRLADAFDRLKRFTADASHELRTPLTSLKSVGEVALQAPDGRPSTFYREVIGSMLEEADRLHRLVADLLTLTRADGAASLPSDPVDLQALTQSVLDDLSVLAEEKGQGFQADLRPAVVRGDAETLRLVLVNLLDNAIKYTPEGGRITVCLIDMPEHYLAVEVEDTGPGIAQAHQGRVFERFYRVDEGRSREVGGSGLGLAIAQRAALLNGGHLQLESTPGEGSTFRLVLPKTSETDPSTRPGATSSQPS